METALQKAHLLLQTQRDKDAEKALREMLAANPTNASAHSLLAYALYRQDRNEQALMEANTAIGLAPGDAGTYYVKALILLSMSLPSQAQAAISEALRLDPESASYYGVLGMTYLQQKAWKKAIAAAADGLRFDPEHVNCLNVKARAQTMLGRADEAGDLFTEALALDPENANTHANRGWAALQRSDYEGAMTHFREALRLDPMSDWARAGILEALKARRVLYRPLLRYFLWMSRLTTGEQWGVVVALSGVRRALRVIAKQVPLLYIIVIPFSLLYSLFAFLTWTGRPLFALVLRLDRFGRLALPKEEVVASNWIGACLLTSLGSLVLAVLSGVATVVWSFPLFSQAFLILALAAFLMMMPISGIFRISSRHPRMKPRRTALIIYSVGLALLAFAAFVAALIHPVWGTGVALVLGAIFLTGWMLNSWIANLLISLE